MMRLLSYMPTRAIILQLHNLFKKSLKSTAEKLLLSPLSEFQPNQLILHKLNWSGINANAVGDNGDRNVLKWHFIWRSVYLVAWLIMYSVGVGEITTFFVDFLIYWPLWDLLWDLPSAIDGYQLASIDSLLSFSAGAFISKAFFVSFRIHICT